MPAGGKLYRIAARRKRKSRVRPDQRLHRRRDRGRRPAASPLSARPVQGRARRAACNYEVIVLRDQDITIDQQMAFGALLGELSIHPFSPNLPDKPQVIILDYSRPTTRRRLTDIWHVDETFREAPPMATILRAKVVPEAGGDTLFASDERRLSRPVSERMKQHIHGLEAQHDFKPMAAAVRRDRPRPSCASSRTISPIPGIPWCGSIRSRAAACSTSTASSAPASRTSRATRATRCSSSSTPGHHPRVPAAGEVAAQHPGDVGQPLGPALCRHDYYPARRTMERVTVNGDRPRRRHGAALHTRHRRPPTAPMKPAIADGTRPGPKRAFRPLLSE